METIAHKTTVYPKRTFSFHTPQSNWYIIAITARVKSEKQRGKTETDDEDLKVTIDGIEFPLSDTSGRLFDSPAAFSGGSTHNTAKVVYYILYLEKGEHSITVTADKQGELLNISYDYITLIDNKFTFSPNLRAEKKNYDSWVTFVFVNMQVSSMNIEAHLKWQWFDGDDIKVAVNGEMLKNSAGSERIFTTSPWNIFGGKDQTETFTLPVPNKNLYYIELIADQSPTLLSAEFLVTPIKGEGSAVTVTTLRQYNPGANGEDYNRFDSKIIKAVSDWNVFFLAQKFPPSVPLDPNLVKAMIYEESKMGYYNPGVSYYPSYPDVMQIADPRNPAIHTLNSDGWVDPNTNSVAKENEWTENGVVNLNYNGEANGSTPEASIKWGVRWLYHRAQGITNEYNRFWRTWKQAVEAYNGEGNPDYIDKVYEKYESGN